MDDTWACSSQACQLLSRALREGSEVLPRLIAGLLLGADAALPTEAFELCQVAREAHHLARRLRALSALLERS